MRSQLPRPWEVQRDLLARVHALLPSLVLQINMQLPQLVFQSVEEFAVLAPRLQENHLLNQQHPLSSCSWSIRRRSCWKRKRALSPSCKRWWPTKCLTNSCGWRRTSSAPSQRSGWMVRHHLAPGAGWGQGNGSTTASSRKKFELRILAELCTEFLSSGLRQQQSNFV